jgi:two-component system phosphate regulon response regulator PhoB
VATILLVEDNEAIAEAVVSYLELADHTVVSFPGSEGVVAAVRNERPDLAVLDVMLPGESGFALARMIRDARACPFVFLTARESEGDRILGFELGAEDYVVKPFSPRELVLRIEAILRRVSGGLEPPSAEGREFSANGDLSFFSEERTLIASPSRHELVVDDTEVKLTASEWRILIYLVRRPGVLVSREQLLTEGLDYLHDGSERTVDTHVKNIRAKLTGSWIETVRGFGYRFLGEER